MAPRFRVRRYGLGGWPWWFAGEQSSPQANAILGKAGIPLWVLFGIAATVALVRLRRERV